MEHGRLDDACRRPADGVVAAGERRPASRRVVRDDDGRCDHRHDRSGGEDDEPCPPPSVPERVPDAEHRDDEPHLLLGQARGDGAERERQQAVLVEKPDRPEQERRRERDRMEVVDHEPLRRRVEQVDEREAEPRPFAAEVLAGEQEDRHGAERDADALNDEEHVGARPQPPERREQRHERVEVGAEPRELHSLEVGHLEEPAVRRRPHGLGQVPDVEAPRLERLLLEHGERRHPGGERAHRKGEERARAGHAPAIARSSNARQRAPRTASLARAS